jgi:two-component system CheB/CheR fusion protein
VVALGASAGGLAAFEAFFAGLSEQADPGMALVLLQHLAPDFNSLLSELIQRHTHLPVQEVEDGMLLQPNHVNVIPPDRDMACQNGRLQLLEPTAKRGHRQPIDFFFRSLALDLGERAVATMKACSAFARHCITRNSCCTSSPRWTWWRAACWAPKP